MNQQHFCTQNSKLWYSIMQECGQLILVSLKLIIPASNWYIESGWGLCGRFIHLHLGFLFQHPVLFNALKSFFFLRLVICNEVYWTLCHLWECWNHILIQGPPNLWQRTFWPGTRIKTKIIENLLQQLIAK